MTARAAVVLKSEKNRVIVLTADGDFRSVRWRAPLPKPGEEVVLKEPAIAQRKLLAVALAAAFLLVAVFPSIAWALKPAAYIALDINPSIGLEVTRLGRVKSGEGFDDEGQKILQQVAVRGLLPTEAVERLVQQAAKEGFVTGRGDDVIVISQVHLQSAPLPTLPELEAAADRALKSTGKEVFVAVEEASRGELEEARQQRTSLNKVRLLKKLEEDRPPRQSADTNTQSKEKTTKDSLKKILADSGKKAPEVFQQGSLKGQSEKESDKKGGPGRKPLGTDQEDINKPANKMPNNKTPRPTKQDPKKPDTNKTGKKMGSDDKKDKEKPETKPPGQNKKDRGRSSYPKEKPLVPPNNKSNKNHQSGASTPRQRDRDSSASWPLKAGGKGSSR